MALRVNEDALFVIQNKIKKDLSIEVRSEEINSPSTMIDGRKYVRIYGLMEAFIPDGLTRTEQEAFLDFLRAQMVLQFSKSTTLV
jgi:hypothetical protein